MKDKGVTLSEARRFDPNSLFISLEELAELKGKPISELTIDMEPYTGFIWRNASTLKPE